MVAVLSTFSRANSVHADFKEFDRRAQEGDSLSVVFFGGSLTWGAQATDPQRTSYRALVGQRLEAHYPKAHFHFWDAAIGGTGSQLGAFRLERDVLARNPDLVFLEFTINDDPCSVPDPHRLASYESLVRRLVQAGVPVLQVILPVKKDALPNPPPRPLDERHKEIAKAYALPVADAVALVKERVAAGKATPDQLWDLSEDQTHPGDAGYALYAEAAWNTYSQAVASGVVCRVPTSMLNANTYMTVNRWHVSGAPLPAGWRVGLPRRSAVAFDFTPSRWLDDVVIADGVPAGAAAAVPLHFSVQGQDIFLFGEASPNSGHCQLSIDDKPPIICDVGAVIKDGNGRWVQTVAQDLDPSRVHHLTIAPQLAPGEEFRLESICVAGGPATVTP
jgi:lysophospholipase L1-like esterase